MLHDETKTQTFRQTQHMTTTTKQNKKDNYRNTNRNKQVTTTIHTKQSKNSDSKMYFKHFFFCSVVGGWLPRPLAFLHFFVLCYSLIIFCRFLIFLVNTPQLDNNHNSSNQQHDDHYNSNNILIITGLKHLLLFFSNLSKRNMISERQQRTTNTNIDN